MDPRMTFSKKEIALAFGADLSSITNKVNQLAKDGKLEKGKTAFTYEEVKEIIRTPRRGTPDPRKVEVLKKALLNDALIRK